MRPEAGAVLDASALLAYLQAEPGGMMVRDALSQGAVISTANYAEVLTRLSDAGEDPDAASARLTRQGLIGGLLEVVPLIEDDAVAMARLRQFTRVLGLSLGDRACIATAMRLQQAVITADRTWSGLSLDVTIHQTRP